MKEYIEREAAVGELMPIYKSASFRNRNVFSTARKCLEAIEAIPAADVVEVRHGRWEQVEVRDYPNSNLMVASMWCPVCKRYHNEVYYYGNPTEMAHYCGFCGARMDGGVNDGKT